MLLLFGCVRPSDVSRTETSQVVLETVDLNTAVPSMTATKIPLSATVTSSPVPSATATPACPYIQGHIVQTNYSSEILDEDIPVLVYLPPCHDQLEQRYPALYLLHGFPMDETHWNELGASELAGSKISSKMWPAFIMVMPLQPSPLFTSTDGGPRSYEIEMVEGLIPYVDRTYKTIPSPDARSVAGISRGGVWALEIALRHPDIFGSVSALSPALHVNYARPAYDPVVLITKEGPFPERVFLGVGDLEGPFLDATVALGDAIEDKGLVFSLVITHGGHDDATWASLIEHMFEFVVVDWAKTE
jgi:enterochelin esterase-like enzyme